MRKKIRLDGYDYSQNGAYFITICSHNHAHLFGEITDGFVHLNENGDIVSQHIAEIKDHISGAEVTKYVVMPNHVHIILMVNTSAVGTRYIVSETRTPCMASLQEKSKQIVPKAIQQFKASVTRKTKTPDLWQTRYYDHVIRSEKEYQEIWQYTDENPLKWEQDCFFVT